MLVQRAPSSASFPSVRVLFSEKLPLQLPPLSRPACPATGVVRRSVTRWPLEITYRRGGRRSCIPLGSTAHFLIRGLSDGRDVLNRYYLFGNSRARIARDVNAAAAYSSRRRVRVKFYSKASRCLQYEEKEERRGGNMVRPRGRQSCVDFSHVILTPIYHSRPSYSFKVLRVRASERPKRTATMIL